MELLKKGGLYWLQLMAKASTVRSERSGPLMRGGKEICDVITPVIVKSEQDGGQRVTAIAFALQPLLFRWGTRWRSH
jgi:hypothetical protein